MAKAPFESIPGLPQDTEEVGMLVNTSSKEAVSRINMARVLEDSLDFLKTTSRNRDFFTGYSLSEVITERLALIGGTDDDADSYNIRRRTLLSELSYLEVVLLDTIDKIIESLETVGEVEMAVDTESSSGFG
jgi:hypothetical protein